MNQRDSVFGISIYAPVWRNLILTANAVATAAILVLILALPFLLNWRV